MRSLMVHKNEFLSIRESRVGPPDFQICTRMLNLAVGRMPPKRGVDNNHLQYATPVRLYFVKPVFFSSFGFCSHSFWLNFGLLLIIVKNVLS